MKKIQKQITINAPKETVWSVLLEDNFTRNWYSCFGEGLHAVTDWIVGHKVLFIDQENNGMIGRIAEKQPYDFLRISMQGISVNGTEDYESSEALAIKNTEENYELSVENGNTTLSISADMDDDYYESMSVAWENALQRIGELSVAVANNPV